MGNIKTKTKVGESAQTGREKPAAPKKYGVFLLNDDYTPMDFVVKVLTEIFWLPEERAVAVMLLVHHEGKGLCGVYTRDMAQTKQQQVMQRAKREGHPLQCIVEEV
ncbi:MAG: ATP-dependent Clp protease adapter ClpS [Neisseria sp.]|nr:ATP-dependent Clp protease adapter ClpS [Neisseria sp.]